MKIKWLNYIGIALLIAFFVVGVTSFSGYRQFQYPFIILGFALSIIVIGLGEILYKINNGEKKEGKLKE